MDSETGHLLRRAREYLHLSAQEVAIATKLSKRDLSEIESQKRNPTSAELAALARIYQRPPEAFRSGTASRVVKVKPKYIARAKSKLTQLDYDEILEFQQLLEDKAQLSSRKQQ